MNKLISALIFSALMLSLNANASERFISVQGQGEVEISADFITLSLRINAQDKTSTQAKAKVDSAMKAVLSIADKYQIKKAKIEAFDLNSHPFYSYENNQRQLQGEEVSRTVAIKLTDLSKHTELLHGLVAIKNVQIERSELGFNNTDKASDKALELALINAKQKAEKMAKTLDNSLGKVLSIEEQNTASIQPMMAMRMSAKMDSSPAPQIIQKQKINAQVLVRFELK